MDILALAANPSSTRARRTVEVSQSYAWAWWLPPTPDASLVPQDPDVTDQLGTPRSVSLAGADWRRVRAAAVYAVASAVRTVGTGAPALLAPPLQVALPMPLNDSEAKLVASRVGWWSPVRYWFERGIVEDGRHRLWLTRPADLGPYPVPLLPTHLAWLPSVLDGELPADGFASSLDQERQWWQDAPRPLVTLNRPYLRVLAHAYAKVTSPAPLPQVWAAHAKGGDWIW